MHNFYREKSAGNRFHEKKSARDRIYQKESTFDKFHEQKISMQQVPWTKYVSQGIRLLYKFHEQKNEHETCFTSENQRATGSTKKEHQHSTSPINKICFTMREKYCTSFTRRKVNMQEISRTKIAKRRIARTKISTQRAA